MSNANHFPTRREDFTFHHLHGCNMHARLRSLPEGFKEHKPGEPCPLPPDARVELMIRTKAGLGSSGVTLAKMHDWKLKGIGAVHGYRTVQMFAGLNGG